MFLSRLGHTLPFLLAAASFAAPPQSLDHLYAIARGQGPATSWSLSRIHRALAEEPEDLLDAYLGLGSRLARETTPSRLDPRESMLFAAKRVDAAAWESALRRKVPGLEGVEDFLAIWALEGFVAEDPDQLFAVAAQVPPHTLLMSGMQRAFAKNLAAILERGSARNLEQLARTAPQELAPAVVAAVELTGGPEAVQRLIALYRLKSKDYQLAVLKAVATPHPASSVYGVEDLEQLLVEAASHPEHEQRRCAMAGLGAFRHLPSVPLLLDALESEEDRSVSALARRALAKIAGKDLGSSPDDWFVWYEGALGWEQEKLPELLIRLRSDSPSVLRGALLEAAERRVHHASLTATVEELLTHPEPAIQVAAAKCLERLASLYSVRPLVFALQDSPPAIHRVLRDAVQSITGTPLPEDPENIYLR